MFKIIAIVGLLSLAVHSQRISAGEDVRPRQYLYQDETAEDEARQVQPYKATRRIERLPAYHFETEESKPEIEYAFPIRYQTEPSENYQYVRSSSKDFEVIKPQYAQLRLQSKKQPIVEQYLKEVTPTTKTVYSQRPGNYLRLNTQSEGTKNREETPARPILKQSPVRYVLQSDLQQKPQSTPYHFEIPEVTKSSQKPYELQSNHPNLVAYQNQLLAHQKVVEANPDNQDDSSKSAIYVSHNIPKKPIRTKVNKPKIVEAQIENVVPNYDYYSQLQQLHNERQKQLHQLQQIQKNKAHLYETSPQTFDGPKSQKVEAAYQVGPDEGNNYPEVSPYQTIRQKPEKVRSPIRQRPVKYEIEAQYESPEPSYEYQPEHVQYQKPGPKQHPKYLPEPKAVRYQPTAIEDAESAVSPQEEALVKYQATIQKYHHPQQLKENHSPRYQQELRYQPVKYQYTEESQIIPQYKELEPSFEGPITIRTRRPGGRGPPSSFRPSSQESVRFFRSRPVSYIVSD